MPVAATKGMSVSGHCCERTPFWPWRGGELVADDGVPVQAHEDVGPLQAGVRGAYNGNLLHHAHLLALQVACLGPACSRRKHLYTCMCIEQSQSRALQSEHPLPTTMLCLRATFMPALAAVQERSHQWSILRLMVLRLLCISGCTRV